MRAGTVADFHREGRLSLIEYEKAYMSSFHDLYEVTSDYLLAHRQFSNGHDMDMKAEIDLSLTVYIAAYKIGSSIPLSFGHSYLESIFDSVDQLDNNLEKAHSSLVKKISELRRRLI